MKEPAHVNSVAFLLSQIGARSAQLFTDLLEPLDLPPRMYGVLASLAVTGPRTQQQIADALGIHRNNMVGLVDELEAADWVRRHRNASDRRAFDVRLTRSGAAIVARVGRMLPHLDAEVGGELSDAEREVLAGLLRRVADGLGLTPGVHPSMTRLRNR